MRKEVIGNATLYCGDCMDVLPTLGKVDAVVTDPPYGTTQCKWDSVIPFDKMWSALKGVTKSDTPILLFGSEPFSSALRMSNLKQFKYDWIWEKNKATGHLNASVQPMNSYEVISVFYSKPSAYNPQFGAGESYSNKHTPEDSGECYGNVKESRRDNVTTRFPRRNIYFPVDMKASFHPTQKPVELLQYLVKTYTNEGDAVCDFTMGSGTTGVAAIKLGRHFIGIEKEPKYFDIACKRIEQAVYEMSLFA